MDRKRQNPRSGISDVFRLRREDVPHPDRLYHETRLLNNKLYEDSCESRASEYEKGYLDINDLKLVMQAEIALHGERPKDFAYSLTMVTGMLLARSVAARPGAIYATTFKENGEEKTRWPGLESGDIIFTFVLTAASRVHANSTRNDTNKMRVRLRSTRAIANLPLSVPYRLLAMAISDGVLANIVTVDDAFDAPGTIYARPRFKHTPVFRWPEIDGDRAAVPASDAVCYLKVALDRLNCPPNNGYRALRRLAATDLVRRVGKDTARRILGHHPASLTLELFYLCVELDLDLTAILMDEEIEAGGHSAEMRRGSPQARRLDPIVLQ
ncbi:hypothetical protein LTR10_000569 [Elasticomyces elasticus]|nr:hypothetical protein LTR10_000569 [Elasticomyces elasticus]KAK4980183.1 hypothetical protein LTR42_000490 [Elasticomyces elasticus]